MHEPVIEKNYVQPLGLLRGFTASRAVKEGQAMWLAGKGDKSSIAFCMLRVIIRQQGKKSKDRIIPVVHLQDFIHDLPSPRRSEIESLLERICAPRTTMQCFGALDLTWQKPRLQGIVNVTPDSFSDGGRFDQLDKAVEHARQLIAAGADIIDIGGESTRPGAAAVSVQEELDRVIPVIEGLKDIDIALSIDSRRADVMEEAVKSGANIINDVSALGYDNRSKEVAAKSNCPVILMHAQNTPENMQDNPQYDDVVLDIYDYLEDRIRQCEAAGIERGRLIVDPGIGFGKTVDHNIEIIKNLSLFHGLGLPVLLGVSRKSFIGHITGEDMADKRLAGSLAAGIAGLDQGVQILRVHDVAETKQALDIWQAVTL